MSMPSIAMQNQAMPMPGNANAKSRNANAKQCQCQVMPILSNVNPEQCLRNLRNND